MTPDGTRLFVRTSLSLSVQFDEFDYRLFLRNYHRELRQRFPLANIPAYGPEVVLDELLCEHEEICKQGQPGGRFAAMLAFARRVHRLHLCLTGSDYGSFEQRASPYNFDRTFYHLGRELVAATLVMDYPGHNPYRSTRRINIPFVRENTEELLELLPDYLWWSMHDKRDMLSNVLAPEQLNEVRRLIEHAGFKLDSFGLYLTSFEVLLLPGDEPPFK